MWLAAAVLGLAGVATGLTVALTSGGSPSLPSTTLQVQFTPWSLAFSPDGRLLAIAGGSPESVSGEVELLNVATGKITANWQLPGTTEVHTVAFSPDGKTLVTGDDKGVTTMWEVATHRITATLTSQADTSDKLPPARVEAAAFHPRGAVLATGDEVGATLWTVATGRVAAQLDTPFMTVFALAFSPDGGTLAAAELDIPPRGAIQLWDVRSAKPRPSRRFTANDPHSVAFSPDGAVLASADGDGAALWDAATGRPLARLAAGSTPVSAVAFSPDGKTLAAGGANGVTTMWEVATHRITATLTGQASAVQRAAFSPDGKILATSSYDNTVRLWRTGG